MRRIYNSVSAASQLTFSMMNELKWERWNVNGISNNQLILNAFRTFFHYLIYFAYFISTFAGLPIFFIILYT